MTDAERDVKLRESVADVIACPHTYPSGSDYVKADRVMQIILAERDHVRKETIEECAQVVDTTEGESVDEMVRNEAQEI